MDLPRNAGMLPPRTFGRRPCVRALSDPKNGLPQPETAAVRAETYKPKLALDFAGQPSVGVGVDPFGTYAAGGIWVVFSDMLGNHTLVTRRR